MLTGLSPARIGITNITQIKPKPKPTQLVVEPPRPTALPLEEITIAEMLARNGYISAAIGKWHLGDDPYNPYNQGFAISIAGRNDGSDYFDPYTGSLARELKWTPCLGQFCPEFKLVRLLQSQRFGAAPS